jgi:hypothetical protein
MTKTGFDAKRFLTKLNGRDYLEVKWRLLWLRTEHPDAVVRTELVEHADDAAVFRADVSLPSGASASGWGTESADDFEDYVEKAETKALGRALAALGFGTQFCEDFSVDAGGGHPVDAPVASPEMPAARQRGARSRATDPQVKAIYAIARDKHWGHAELQGRCRSMYGRLPEELGRTEASQFIDALRAEAPHGVPAVVGAAV